jgi:hypothetical protein
MFGEPAPVFANTPELAPAMIAARTSAGEAVGRSCKYIAATPATNGLENDVPEANVTVVGVVFQIAGTPSPGANNATQDPKLE